MYKVLFMKDFHIEGQLFLRKQGCRVVVSGAKSEAELVQELVDVDALFVRREPVTSFLIDQAPQLKVIGQHGTGIDNIDVTYAHKKGIVVVNAPGANALSVAEHTLFLILACAKQFGYIRQELHNCNPRIRFSVPAVEEITGKTLGIIGYGHIGRLVAEQAMRGFAMKVFTYSRSMSIGRQYNGVIGVNSMTELLEKADFVSLHIPLNKQTQGFFGKKQFKQMKSSAYFINMARGGVVVESELIEALQSGDIRGAGLDVFMQEEPLAFDNPLFHMPQVIATPHIGGGAIEANCRVSKIVAVGMWDVLCGREPQYPVYSK